MVARYTERMRKIEIEHHGILGGAWIAAWLFTIGYLKLGFWKGLIAVIVWPYFLGEAFAIVP